MTTKTIFMATALVLGAAAALAQGAPGLNLLGTVAQVDATTITLTQEGGGERHLALAPNVLVVQGKPATLADIRPDDYIASAAIHGRDGKLHSTELRIFPAAMRGLGEGQRPMNDAREQTMTNAVVTGTAIADGSNDLKVTFAGGASELVVDPGIPVTRIAIADRSLVRPGAAVRVQGSGDQVARITLQ